MTTFQTLYAISTLVTFVLSVQVRKTDGEIGTLYVGRFHPVSRDGRNGPMRTVRQGNF